MEALKPAVLAVDIGPADFAALVSSMTGTVDLHRAATIENAIGLQEIFAARAILCDADSLDWRRALRQLYRLGTPVIFLARNADERLWLEMLDAGAFDVLSKPYRPEELRWVISCAVSRKQQIVA